LRQSKGAKPKQTKKFALAVGRETTDRVLKTVFAYLKLAALKIDKYAINLKCLTR